MKKILFLLLYFALLPVASHAASRAVHVIHLDDQIINPISQEYIVQAIRNAEKADAECLIIQLDTPGGLLQSTRGIVKEIINSSVPVITYISPSGSRAGSAGVFITLSSHIACMAPSTNIGAAHPVNLGGEREKNISDVLYQLLRSISKDSDNTGTPEEKTTQQKTDSETAQADEDNVLADKILNDTSAWVRAIAAKRNKNIEWAEDAVRQSVSQTENEALDKNVIDFIASDLKDLLKHAHGRTVYLANGTEKTLALNDTYIVINPMSVRQKILMAISHPNIAYILMMLGFYGLLFEVTHPGIGFPGVAGAICLILAFFSLSMLPLNYAGLLLIGLALLLFIAEANIVSYGLLSLGGLICMFLGSLLLIETEYNFMRISLSVMLPFIAITAALTIVCVGAILRVHTKKSLVGNEGMIGQIGTAETDINPFGTIFIHGEIWQARSKSPIKKGERVRVCSLKNLELTVEKE
jgi:membrane-bound serine protease (ClpP class)